MREGRAVQKLALSISSIIVPAYNIEKHVSKCITSLFKNAEQYPNFCEIMVVDYGSSDYTYEITWATIQK